MRSRQTKHLLLCVLIAVLLGVTAQQGFGDAWVSQYTFASAPIVKPDTAAKPVPSTQGTQEPDSIMKPKPVALSNRIAEYHIDVQLQENTHILRGEQTVTWTNPGKQQVSELYFHLYPNAFESMDTTFMRESGGKLRNDKATEASTGYMHILALETMEGESLLPRLHFVQPDDGNANDQTLAKVRLPYSVAPGKTTTLKMKFEVKLPEVFARMGYSGNFVMAGQWFPKLCVYETIGTRGRTTEGWNVHQYHGNSEFYSDFGIYSVKIKFLLLIK